MLQASSPPPLLGALRGRAGLLPLGLLALVRPLVASLGVLGLVDVPAGPVVLWSISLLVRLVLRLWKEV